MLVATIQSFRVRQTQGRNVYAFSEEFDLLRADPAPDLPGFALVEKLRAGMDMPAQLRQAVAPPPR